MLSRSVEPGVGCAVMFLSAGVCGLLTAVLVSASSLRHRHVNWSLIDALQTLACSLLLPARESFIQR